MHIQKPIPLDPGKGGRSIGTSALEMADIIVSTTSQAVSTAIRIGTDASVSHSMVYIGGGMVVEAIGSGVVTRPLGTAVRDAVLAVAYRHPRMTRDKALIIRDIAGKQLDRPYDIPGAAIAGLRGICVLKSVAGSIIGGPSPSKFFCSQLVIYAFHQAGVPLTHVKPECVTPGAIVQIALASLKYIGHLIARTTWLPTYAP
jgi:cell wall-associated NlpC family hydrolase